MGRQKQYTKRALVRLTEAEYIRLVELAKEATLSLSRFLAECGLAGKAPSFEDRERQERAIMEVKRVGNNLNQIARQLNAQRGTINAVRVEQTLVEAKSALEMLELVSRRR